MPVKQLIGRGIGYSPGGPKYIVTHGLSLGASAVLTVRSERTLVWAVAPSPNRVSWALYGRDRPAHYTFRFERRSVAGQFLEDVTAAFIQNTGRIEANNDRDVFRTLTIDVDPTADVTLDTLRDNVLVVMDLLVDGTYLLPIPMGLFVMVRPQNIHTPAHSRQRVQGFDLGFLLANQTTPSTYTVASGANYVTAAAAVVAAVNSDIRVNFPSTTKTLPTDMSWGPGTAYIRVPSQLISEGIDHYLPWADGHGVLRTRAREDLSARTPDMTLTGDDFIVAEAIEESQADIWYNQVIVYVDDPARAPDSVVRTNNDPSSPISVVNTGRTFTKSIQADRAADNATLITIAENFLREQASQLQHLKITASIDPRRDAHEVLSLEVDGVIASSNWWVRNFSIELKTGGRMTYDLSRTAAVVAT